MKNEAIDARHLIISAIVLTIGISAVSTGVMATPPVAAEAEKVRPPHVPGNIVVDPPDEIFLVGQAAGTQNYVCLPSGSGVAWALFTPQATLFTGKGKQLITHFFSPNPSPNRAEHGIVRPTWQDSRDTSSVWGKAIASSVDAAFVKPGAIAWLKIQVVGAEDGPGGGDRLSGTSFIQRVNTVGGAAPSTGCSVPGDVGRQAYMPYTADYIFYELKGRHDR